MTTEQFGLWDQTVSNARAYAFVTTTSPTPAVNSQGRLDISSNTLQDLSSSSTWWKTGQQPGGIS